MWNAQRNPPRPLRFILPDLNRGGAAVLQRWTLFRRDETGRVQLVGDFPHVIFQRVPWYENRTLNFAVIIASGGVFALTLALWPIAAITRRHYGRKLDLARSQLRLRLFVRIVCALDLTFLIVIWNLFDFQRAISVKRC